MVQTPPGDLLLQMDKCLTVIPYVKIYNDDVTVHCQDRVTCLKNNFNSTFPEPVNTLRAAVGHFQVPFFCCKDSWNYSIFVFNNNVIIASNIIAVTAQYSKPTTIPEGDTTSRCSHPILYIVLYPRTLKK